MKILGIVTLFIISIDLFSQDYQTSVILDPSISKRCQALIEKRNDKVRHKQKLQALLKRNKRLQKHTPERKKSILAKLKRNGRELQHELHLALYRIDNMEENIVRQGCPGLKL